MVAVSLLASSAAASGASTTATPAATATDAAASSISSDELALLWESQRSEIATAHVEFLCANGSLENPLNTPERVAQLLTDFDLVRHPESLLEFLQQLVGQPFAVKTPAEAMVLTVSGRRHRIDDPFSRFVTDGNLEAEYVVSNRQVTLQPPGQSRVHHYDLRDLRWIPPPGVSAASWRQLDVRENVASFDVPPRPDGTAFRITTDLDLATGIVTHSITRYPDGNPAIEMYQSGLEVLSSGIVFPKVRINLTYADGVAYQVRVIVIQSARLNEPVDEAVFALAVPAKTRVVDFRTSPKAVYIAPAAQADALTIPLRNLDAPPRTAPALSATDATSDRWPILLAVHAAVLLVLATVTLWRRRSAARQT